MIEKIKILSEKYYERIRDIRHLIHMYPEDGFQEFKTSKLIVEELENLGIEIKQNIAKTGVVGLLKGSKPGKTVMLRADMDELKLEEKADVPYKSKIPGMMHGCGHDGHVAGLLGTAMILSELKEATMGAEDFSYFTKEVPCIFFFLGIAADESNPVLHHNPYFKWEDKNLKILSEGFAQI